MKLTWKPAFLKKICNSLVPFSAAVLLILRLLDILVHPSLCSLGLLLKDCRVRKGQSRQHTSRRECKCLSKPIYLNSHPFNWCCHFGEVFSFFCLDHRLLCWFNLLKRNLNLRELVINTKTWWHLQLMTCTHTVQLHCKKVSLMMGTGSFPSFQSSMPSVQDMSDICIYEIPATTHSQGQCLDLYSVLQIHVGFSQQWTNGLIWKHLYLILWT